MFTKPLLMNSRRGKAWLETPRLLLIHGITKICECDTSRDVLLGVHTAVFCSVAASPSWPSLLLPPALAAAVRHQNPFPVAGTAPSLARPLGSCHHRSPARRWRGWTPGQPPASTAQTLM